MKETRTWVMFIFLSSVFLDPSGKHLPNDKQLQVNERFGMKSSAQLMKIVKNDGFPDAAGSLGGVGSLLTIDYKAPPGEVIKNVGDAVVPILCAGLSLIPGVGPIIAGVVSALWGIFGSLFGGEDPMKKVIDDIYDEINSIKEKINEIAEKIPKEMRKEREAQFRSLVNKAVHGKMIRNNYVCEKYARASKIFSDNLTLNKTISGSERVEMVALLEDCDNFLKDTAEAFVYPEYCDVLWVPSVITTLMRASFLTEVANYGYVLKLDPEQIHLFWSELKDDLEQHFALYENVALKRMEIYRESYTKINNYDIDGCKLQRQLLFLDREMYPHGVPQYVQIPEDDGVINLADYNVTKNNEPHHIQVLHKETPSKARVFNCLWGPGIHTAAAIPIEIKMSFGITYIRNKTYLIRIAYFIPEYPSMDIDKPYDTDMIPYDFSYEPAVPADDVDPDERFESFEKVDYSSRNVIVQTENNNSLKITFGYGAPNEGNQRFVRRVASIFAQPVPEQGVWEFLNPKDAYSGFMVFETIAAIDILPEDDSRGNIQIESNLNNVYWLLEIVFGVEIIALPLKR